MGHEMLVWKTWLDVAQLERMQGEHDDSSSSEFQEQASEMLRWTSKIWRARFRCTQHFLRQLIYVRELLAHRSQRFKCR